MRWDEAGTVGLYCAIGWVLRTAVWSPLYHMVKVMYCTVYRESHSKPRKGFWALVKCGLVELAVDGKMAIS